ncbi:tetratricopeptide repeat-containing sulfotransferase family protein [Allosphingosinicella indica]|uniref:Tetratricopeptide repeat-containing protein n=1 Tax=Allosphingosinicella indica TaxID=941907 RepID=A0A1X7H2M5_9SPHN|nr:sulfotransferase [Allosphingosinicella indica]SMF78719.1 Tetratricopeptide repeat-containing protein [Allosphingosinicella indica]
MTSAGDLSRTAAALMRGGRHEEAIKAYRALLASHPDTPSAWYNLGYLLRHARRFEDALAAYAEALGRGIDAPEEVHLNRAVILIDHLARPDDAQAELEAALALRPDYGPALLNLGNLHEDRGDREAARAAYTRALDVSPGGSTALVRLAGLVTGDERAAMIAQLQPAFAVSSGEERAALGFALGRLLDADGDYDAAFAAYRDANAASGAGGSSYDRSRHDAFVDRLIATFPVAAAPPPVGKPPVFICGMFRSGSTLVEQILGRHSRVTPGGELDIISALIWERLRPYPDAVASPSEDALLTIRDAYLAQARARHPGADLLTDKRPDNFLHIGLIKTLFPDAKIVHTVRDPRDTLLSLYFLHLDASQSYAQDLEDAAHWHRAYARLIAHWRGLYGADIHDVDYDALVADPRAELAPLLDFLGLEWEEGLLDFHTADNAVRTASVWQVREPLYRRSSGRWRNYAHLLPDLGL